MITSDYINETFKKETYIEEIKVLPVIPRMKQLLILKNKLKLDKLVKDYIIFATIQELIHESQDKVVTAVKTKKTLTENFTFCAMIYTTAAENS